MFGCNLCIDYLSHTNQIINFFYLTSIKSLNTKLQYFEKDKKVILLLYPKFNQSNHKPNMFLFIQYYFTSFSNILVITILFTYTSLSNPINPSKWTLRVNIACGWAVICIYLTRG